MIKWRVNTTKSVRADKFPNCNDGAPGRAIDEIRLNIRDQFKMKLR